MDITVADAFAYLETTDIPETVALLFDLEAIAKQAGMSIVQRGAQEAALGLLRDVNEVAVQMAGVAEGLIVSKLLETRAPNRPQGDGTLQSHIRAEPGPLGLVKVGMIEELDRAINPRGDYHSFWRAQEYGTGVSEGGYGGGGIESQEGRRLFGTFDPSGTPPDSAQAGLRRGRDLAFIPMGTAPGEGVIHVDLPARHFLRDGAEEAGVRYLRAMGDVGAKWNAKLQELLVEMRRAARSAGGFIGILEA